MTETIKINTLRKRSDYILISHGSRVYTKGLIIQAKQRSGGEYINEKLIRVGITCSKKIGNAVKRNRAKRRLRELSRLILPQYAKQGWDYVLLGKAEETCYRPFKSLVKDLESAIEKIHRICEE